MAAERNPGSDRGRPVIDWEQAFVYYASLPDPDRSYHAVAQQFDVSVRTVEGHGRREHWKQRLTDVQAKAAESADIQLAQERARKIAELEMLIDASMTTFAHQLRAGTVKVVPADLVRLFKLREELWAQEAAATTIRRASEAAQTNLEDPEERKREVARALHEAGAFDRLQHLLTNPNDTAHAHDRHQQPPSSGRTEEAA